VSVTHTRKGSERSGAAPGALIHHRLQATARERPDAIAVVDGDRSFTYAQLAADAARVAHRLREVGVGRGDRVGLFLEKSYEAIVGVYGVLAAGGAYVPLDPRGPSPRLGYIAANCGLTCLLSSRAHSARVPGLVENGAVVEHLVLLDELPGTPAPPLPPPAPGTSEDDLAYILYTSGSTGVPKGVMLSHRNALAFVDWAVAVTGAGAQDRLSSHAPLHFDLSVFDLYAASSVGATLVLVPHKVALFPVELARFIAHNEISVWYSVPSALTMLVEKGGLSAGALPGLRTVIFAGEVFPTRYLHALMTLLPHATFWNWYGPTETNVCTGYRVPAPPDPDGPDIPIGAPIAGVDGIVVGEDGTPVAPGEPGELVIAGPTVMRGYWARDAETAQRLVTLSVDGRDVVVYRTGDLVAAEADGNYRFLGRRDNQIKSRGFRIELGEIETAIHAHGDVLEGAVVAVPDDLVTNRIRAFVVLRDGTTSRDVAAFVADRLPKYMVPEHFAVLDALPRTSTGKIDRQALAGMAS
jgi:amino acid adenylation domain-containing protein